MAGAFDDNIVDPLFAVLTWIDDNTLGFIAGILVIVLMMGLVFWVVTLPDDGC